MGHGKEELLLSTLVYLQKGIPLLALPSPLLVLLAHNILAMSEHLVFLSLPVPGILQWGRVLTHRNKAPLLVCLLLFWFQLFHHLMYTVRYGGKGVSTFLCMNNFAVFMFSSLSQCYLILQWLTSRRCFFFFFFL